jgi:hypothetical protein
VLILGLPRNTPHVVTCCLPYSVAARNETLPRIVTISEYGGKRNWIPLVAAFAVLVSLNLSYRLFKFLYRHTTKQDDEDDDLSDRRDFIVKGKVRTSGMVFDGCLLATDAM